jgi:dolichol-phosphate mannosyltransferase
MRDTYRRDGDANTSLDRPTSDVLSVVVPCYNEQLCLRATHERLSAALAELADIRYEIIYVDDGSRDATADLLRELHEADPHVTVVLLSRNFGHQLAVTAGLEHATGDAVVLIDADLQDPPEVIAEFVRYWRDGYEVVYGVRTEREGETRFKLWTAQMFYRLLNKLSDVPIPLDVGDFRLMDRKVVDGLRAMPERHRFIRGMVSWVGHRQKAVPYARARRHAGTSKYPLFKMMKFAIDGVTSFSTVPLRLATWVGFFIAGVASLGIVYALAARLFTKDWVSGWAGLFISVLFLGGVQLIFLGVIGEYVGRIYSESKRRPLYLVSEYLRRDTQWREAARRPRSVEAPPAAERAHA